MNKPQTAWIAFGLAGVCVVGAVAYAVMQNQAGDPPSSAPYVPPRYTPTAPPPLPAAAPLPVAPPAPPAPTPPAGREVRLVQVYPGAWAWEPYWHDAFHWDYRYGHKRNRRDWDDRQPWDGMWNTDDSPRDRRHWR